MKSLETSGRTVEEAIQKALETLNLSREEVEVAVVKEGKRGILGLGAEDAIVRVEPLASAPENMDDMAKEVLETLLTRMGVTASVACQTKPPVGDGEGVITLDVTGDDLGILIGRRGQTLSSLQYVVRLIVAHQTQARVPVVIDVEGYKQRRYEALQALAQRMAEQVKTRGRPFTLEPMLAYERRIIHLALADDPDVTTESVGEGETRKVVIMPREQ
ncbi:MAG: KH domain-containing protein [Dehalococcoidia bacterium]|nr:KH domain-containing protein [Dehalococcoidia bacterium]